MTFLVAKGEGSSAGICRMLSKEGGGEGVLTTLRGESELGLITTWILGKYWVKIIEQ